MKTWVSEPKMLTPWRCVWLARRACWSGFHPALLLSVACRSRRNKNGEPAVVVTILPDSGDKYLSEQFWEMAV